MAWHKLQAVAVGLVLGLFASAASSQQATVSTPYHAVGDSYFENIGTSWGINAPGFTLRFGAPNIAAPQFGGFNPAAGGSLGFGFRRGGTSGFFNANFAQGSQRGFVSQTPGVTVTNGVPGFIGAGTASPFVCCCLQMVPCPERHRSQVPHGITAGIRTAFPCQASAPLPAATTRPLISWPSVSGGA